MLYDTVIEGGMVLDPESGLQAIRNVGILNGKIQAITQAPLVGISTIDAKGLVVSPGFIDLHAHGQNLEAQRLQVMDGVTTAIDMEAGVYPLDKFYTDRADKALINFGASVSYTCLRIKVKHGLDCAHFSSDAEPWKTLSQLDKPAYAYQTADDAELKEIASHLDMGLMQGGLGIGLALEYIPAVGRKEVLYAMQLAAERDAPMVVHVRRRSEDVAPGIAIAVAQEVIANAAITGAPLHLCHVTSTGLSDAPVIIDMVTMAESRGLDITMEVYPYGAASTRLGSALFDEGWQRRWGVDYSDLQWAATGERLTLESFVKYRQQQPNGFVIIHAIPESIVRYAVKQPNTIIASDGLPWFTKREHPRGAGTFARVLGRYVRQEKALDLMEALKKMTLLPARRLEKYVPQMRRKGRLQVGSDADITIFDSSIIIDRATYTAPMQTSSGVVYVLVNGAMVVNKSELVEDVYPGIGVRRSLGLS